MNMMPEILYGIPGLLLGSLIGLLIGLLRTQHYKAQLKTEQLLYEQKLSTLQTAATQLSDRFAALSSEALKQNNEAFLKLAEENLKRHHLETKTELEKKEKSIENLLNPIRETLDKTDKQLRDIEKDRKETYGSLSQHLKLMGESQTKLQAETQNLVSALKRPEIRGQWGEMTLKRLAELSGMVQHCDFSEQTSVSTEEGMLRPDMIVRMPDQRELVVDAKTSLDAYIAAVQAPDAQLRQLALERHARKVRDRVKELASKAYWAQFKHSPDYVILFIPGDQFLAAAQEQDTGLLEYALSNKVILATPTSLIALLRAVAFGWRQQAVAKNIEQIQTLGEELYHRIAVFTQHMSKLGKALDGSIENYNSAVGSLERSVLPSARRLAELGIENKKIIETLDPIDKTTRKVDSLIK